jgi:predicted N-acetyltransferase YhbS
LAIVFRTETPDDHAAVEAMTRDVFWNNVEKGFAVNHDVVAVHLLRQATGYVPEISLVAVDDETGEIVGHVIFTRSRIVPPADGAGESVEVLSFGPLTVARDRQGLGIGRALLARAFDEARRLGVSRGPGRREAVVTLGVPDYYPRIGFRRGSDFGLTFGGASFDALLAYELTPGALDGMSGDLEVDPAHSLITPEAASAFDARFPPREPYTPTPIDTLAGRVSDGVLAAVKAQHVETVDDLTGLSQAEVEALPGATAADVEAIRAALRAIGYPWGR